MSPIVYFGASIFPTDAGTTLVTSITGAITDNAAVVLTVLGFMVGVYFVRKWLSSGLRGRA